MAKLRIISPNYLLVDDTGVADSSLSNPQFPPENLLLPHRCRIAKGESGAQYLTLDLGEAKEIQGIAFLDISLSGTMRFAGNSSDSWTSPATGWTALESYLQDGKLIYFLAASASYRYWRFEFTASAAFEIGAMVIGPVWEAPQDGYESVSHDQQAYEEYNELADIWNFPLLKMLPAQSRDLLTILSRHRQVKSGPYHWGSLPTLFALDPENTILSDGRNYYSIYGVVTSNPSENMENTGYMRSSLTVEECK